MSKVVLFGDLIVDEYRHFTATRICPEAPALILQKTKEPYSTPGGAGLVEAQLKALGVEVIFVPITISRKERIFADDRLITRIDTDADHVPDEVYFPDLKVNEIDAVVISDYGKGTGNHARSLMEYAGKLPVFVDAKNTWSRYSDAFAVFPNEKEHPKGKFSHIIQKLGPRGCSVDDQLIPTEPRMVRDVCGAGDIFMAAFVHWWLLTPDARFYPRLLRSAEFANHVAGISVEHVGTHVVTQKEIDKSKLFC